MAKCKLTVYYGRNVAKFSNENDARTFGRAMSREGFLVEMTNKSGLIGQWKSGKATAEFAGYDD